MSVSFQRNNNGGIERSGFIHEMQRISIQKSHEKEVLTGGRRVRMKGEHGDDLDSCSSSTIGGNSDDDSGRSSDGEETEVQSAYKGPLDSMDALEEVLPIRRGISKFYNGKSKSFTCLSETSSISCVQEIAKPENPFNRKRKNLLARSFWDKPQNYATRNSGTGTSKKLSKSSRSTLDLQAPSSSSESINNSEDSNLISSSPFSRLPPRPPQTKTSPNYVSSSPPPRNTPWRSFSLSDLQCAASGAPSVAPSAD